MVLQKLRERLSVRKDPFSVEPLKGLTLEEQERALTQISGREAELIQGREAKASAISRARVSKAISPGIKKLEKVPLSQRVRESLEKKERDRKVKKSAQITSAKGLSAIQRLRQAADSPIPTGRGLSPFQIKIIRRERIMKRVRDTPPMDRPKMLSRSDPFKAIIREIRGVPEPSSSGLVKGSPSQLAQEELRRKITEANQRSKSKRII